MAIYIDADEARMAIAECFLDMNDSFVESATECNAMIDLAIDKIKELPSADVKPVVRGEWTRHYTRPNVFKDTFWHCSVCGYKNPDSCANVNHKYCPNCGARMAEE